MRHTPEKRLLFHESPKGSKKGGTTFIAGGTFKLKIYRRNWNNVLIQGPSKPSSMY